ncbi:MAG: hypothetical protein IPL42_01660 [Saprospiraceae bacterium]|nr:hypothetical protein [Saprospiraceae bacterium]MBK8448784.1 hypothetical protein [Saprospiraceae bacterium]
MQGLHISFIGTPESYFTKKFLVKLQELCPEQLYYFCIKQKERKYYSKQPDAILRFVYFLKGILYYLQEQSSILYWIYYCRLHQIEFQLETDVNGNTIQERLKNMDFVLTAGISSKFKNLTLNASKYGIINFHYSLLPKFRGTHPVFWQLISGDPIFGYSFHLMNTQMDAGDILLQKEVPINSKGNVSSICNQLILHASNQLFVLIAGTKERIVQDSKGISSHSEHDFMNYIRIQFSDPVSEWKAKCNYSPFLILNDQLVVRMKSYDGLTESFPKLKIKRLGFVLVKDGFGFFIEKVNYLPAIFYYFQLKKLFD